MCWQHLCEGKVKEYDKKRHGRGEASHAQKMPIEFIERFSLIGSAEKCTDRLLSIKKLGIERIFVIGPRPDHFGQEANEALACFAKEVNPPLRDWSTSLASKVLKDTKFSHDIYLLARTLSLPDHAVHSPIAVYPGACLRRKRQTPLIFASYSKVACRLVILMGGFHH